jgi:hypothetical protein
VEVDVKVPTELVGCQVLRTAFDWQVRLLLTGPEPARGQRVSAELVVETPFQLHRAGSPCAVTHQPGTGARLAPILDLFGTTVTSVEVIDTGRLHLTFSDGSELVVPPDPDYESWSLTGSGIEGVAVGPGGETDWHR